MKLRDLTVPFESRVVEVDGCSAARPSPLFGLQVSFLVLPLPEAKAAQSGGDHPKPPPPVPAALAKPTPAYAAVVASGCDLA